MRTAQSAAGQRDEGAWPSSVMKGCAGMRTSCMAAKSICCGRTATRVTTGLRSTLPCCLQVLFT